MSVPPRFLLSGSVTDTLWMPNSYISRLCGKELSGESMYYYTQFLSALAYIESLASVPPVEQKAESAGNRALPPVDVVSAETSKKGLSEVGGEAEEREEDDEEVNGVGPFHFVGRTVSDLSPEDLSELFEAYNQLLSAFSSFSVIRSGKTTDMPAEVKRTDETSEKQSVETSKREDDNNVVVL